MPHIHTGPGEHDPTCSAWIIRTDTPEPQMLLHLHIKHAKWMQPGGHVELTETPWQAVLHEIVEETGYDSKQLQILQPQQRLKSISDATLHPLPICENTHPFPDGHKHTDRAYTFVTNELPSGIPGEGESQDIRWVTKSELMAMPDEEVIPNVREIGIYAFEVYSGKSWKPVPLTEFEA